MEEASATEIPHGLVPLGVSARGDAEAALGGPAPRPKSTGRWRCWAPTDGERVLDLACGTGRHSLELARRGFEVVGVDISPDLLEIAEADAEARVAGTPPSSQADLRELDFDDEFDLVLNLNDGAVGYFETEEENRRTFEVIAAALRPGGGNLMQLPNVLYAETHLPQKTWIEGDGDDRTDRPPLGRPHALLRRHRPRRSSSARSSRGSRRSRSASGSTRSTS